MDTTIEELKREKALKEAAIAYALPLTPFVVAWTDIARKYANPSDCKKKLASFNYDKKHWLVYIKK